MKYLYLIRHAKSSWDDPSQTDFERTLNERGIKDAPKMAKLLQSKKVNPDLIISSPAVRAFSTAGIFAAQYKYPSEKILSDARIYEAAMRDLADVVHEIKGLSSEEFPLIPEIKDEIGTAFLFGHNPGISNFANLLSNQPIVDMPTCAIAGFELSINSWSEAERYCGKLILFEYPKKLRM